MIAETPSCGPEELAAIERIETRWHDLRHSVVEQPTRWVGSVRRVLAAVADQGSNRIQGIHVATEDAIAALQGATEPAHSRWVDWQANVSYRRAMTYVLQLAKDRHFEYTPALLRSLHFMMTEPSMDAAPGLWRPAAAEVRSDTTGEVVYVAPDAEIVPWLVDELVDDLRKPHPDTPVIVRAAMAHLNLARIHPFRDGNGRMARALQSLVLVREGILARELCSIEEHLGHPRNQEHYFAVLAEVGGGRWSPGGDARPWVRYCLRAHYIQALSVQRRVQESERIWEDLELLAEHHGLPDRCVDALFDAAIGLRVRNASYRATLASAGHEISTSTVSNDLRAMVRAGLLEPHGAQRGAHYLATDELRRIRERARGHRLPLDVEADELFDPLPSTGTRHALRPALRTPRD